MAYEAVRLWGCGFLHFADGRYVFSPPFTGIRIPQYEPFSPHFSCFLYKSSRREDEGKGGIKQ